MKRFSLFAISVSLLAMSGCVSNGSKQNTSNQDESNMGVVEQSVEQIQIEWSEPKYSIGDIVMIGNDMGVVFAVTTDGEHGKAMSVSQTECSWGSARSWCRKFGSGWRLPKKDELKVISNKMEALNSALTANGYEELVDLWYGWYWSSEEYDSGCAWNVRMSDGSTDYYGKGDDAYVRAVSAF